MRRRLGTALGVGIAVALVLPSGIEAAEFEVTSLDDTGAGSLRAAIEAASEHPDSSSTIVFTEGLDGEIALETPLPSLVKQLEIVGPGADGIAITRDPEADEFRIITVGSGSLVSISGVTIAGGRADIEELPGEWSQQAVVGGGILVAEDAELLLEDAVVRDNVASAADATSMAVGGGIASFGTATIDSSTVSGNLVETRGPDSGSIALGGGIGALSTTFEMTVRLSTVSGNRAAALTLPHGNAAGGGIGSLGYSRATTIDSATIAANAAEGSNPISANLYFTGLFSNGSVRNTILAEPDGARNCFFDPEASFEYRGHTLADDESCRLSGIDDQEDVDPGLEPLADNAGSTPTHAIASGGPAHDQGSSGGFTADQRGLPRLADDPAIPNAPLGDGADVGAFERRTAAPPRARLRVTGRPRQRTVGRRKTRTSFRLRVTNVGDVTSGTVRLCARAPARRVAIRGAGCVVRQIPAGKTRRRAVRVRIKGPARGKATRIRLIARGPNVEKEQAIVRLRARR